MLKPMLFGSFMLLATAAFAQTSSTGVTATGQTGLHTSAPGTNTNTNTVTGQTGVPQTDTQMDMSTGTTTDTTGINTRTGVSTGTTMGTGTTATGSWSNSAATNYTGVGGPEVATTTMAARTYPRCSRTVRDSCIQGGPRRR